MDLKVKIRTLGAGQIMVTTQGYNILFVGETPIAAVHIETKLGMQAEDLYTDTLKRKANSFFKGQASDVEYVSQATLESLPILPVSTKPVPRIIYLREASAKV